MGFIGLVLVIVVILVALSCAQFLLGLIFLVIAAIIGGIAQAATWTWKKLTAKA